MRKFNPDAVVIDSIKLSDLGSNPDFEGRYGRHLGAFLREISSKLSPAEESGGRLYQRETIKNGGLRIVSPFSGKAAVARESFVVDGCIFYYFRQPTEHYVAAGRIKFGYPLLALFVPETNSMLQWEIANERRRGMGDHLKKLAAMFAEQSNETASRPVPASRGGPPAIVFGHMNFAHHLWNELPALERLLAGRTPDPPPEIIVSREPLGAIDSLFPEISGWTIVRGQHGGPSIAEQSSRLFVHLGSYCISASVRRRILHHASANATASVGSLVKQIREARAPVFWLSVRVQKPTLVNQVETLTTLASALVDEFPDCFILFDGFSPPEDCLSCKGNIQEYYRSAAAASKLVIEEIVANLLKERPTAAPERIINAGGLRILDSIALAKVASAYFCHVGTMQHKIGWTANVPGVVHANRNVLSKRAAIWYAPWRLESGIMPDRVEPKTVSGADWNEDYLVLDVGRVVTVVVDNFRRYLSLGSAPGS